MKRRSIFAPYYIVEDGFKSILGMNNSTQFPLDVNPTLYSESGVGMPMPTVRIDPHQPVQVDLSTWVAQLGREFAKGSLQLDFVSVNNGLVAQVMVVNEHDSLMLDVPFRARTEFRSSHLEAIWWTPDRDAEMKVFLANTKDSAIRASLTVTDADGNTIKKLAIPLHPRQLREIKLRDIVARGHAAVGGISISHEGKKGAMMAEGFIVNRAKGFSANLAFEDPATFDEPALHGAGAFLPGGHTGILLLRNTSGTSITVDPVIRRGKHQQALGKLTLAASTSKKLEVVSGLPDMEGQGIGIEVKHNGPPSALIGHWYSVDATESMVVETPLRKPGPRAPGSGSNPFMLTSDFESVLFVKNPGPDRASFVGVIFHGRDQYVLGARFVEPGETMAIDVRKLRDERTPDVFGKVLPLDLESGQFQWLRRSGPRMIGRVMIFSFSKGISTNMSCPQCPCQPGDTGIDLDPESISGEVDDTEQIEVWQTDVSCDFYPLTYPISPEAVEWTSTSSVASVSSTGVVTCASAGTALIEADEWFTVEEEHELECEEPECEGETDCNSVPAYVYSSTDVEVRPTISGGNTVWYFGGATPSGFPTQGAFDDLLGGEALTLPPNPVPGCSGNSTAVQHWGQEWWVGSLTIGSGRRVQTNTLQKHKDFARHTGITSPAP